MGHLRTLKKDSPSLQGVRPVATAIGDREECSWVMACHDYTHEKVPCQTLKWDVLHR